MKRVFGKKRTNSGTPIQCLHTANKNVSEELVTLRENVNLKNY